MSTKTDNLYASKFVDFVNHSPSPFHCVETASRMLTQAGFKRLSEKDCWKVLPNEKYFFTRNQSSIIAFSVGGKFEKGNGFVMVGAHTDSPDLRVKPVHNTEAEGFKQVQIEPYGGGLWTTWFDRDLTIAGRVVVRNNGALETRLVRINKPILRIPTVAIHLDRESGTKLEINKQNHLVPILCTSVKSALEVPADNKESLLLRAVGKELGVAVPDIVDFELSVVDSQPAAIGGLFDEFIFSARLDNQMMSFCALQALIEASSQKCLENESAVWVASMYDNEEVGSETDRGAASPLLPELYRRIVGNDQHLEVSIRNSFLISADMAHAVHPNYADKHDKNHKPQLHKGPVIKRNANQRYATTGISSTILKEIASRNQIPVQEFVVRNDALCGTTIGPIVATLTGVRTVDIGNPQLSMHSIRETCATSDVEYAVRLLKAYYEQFTTLDRTLKGGDE